ncbi:MAG: hypothetical protein CMB77_07200 [Euryarchaeota archaeon]|nr:hypothetical protein [Euryarchaeota archaeon]|tara:strand:- start:2423 stop:3187 length:765 start_codon:yes stop_codon:yes gene_type:complete
MGVTINGSGTITSSTGSLGFDDENVSTSGTITGSGASITALNASNLASGTIPTARLGSGTASSSTILYGNNTWAAAPAAGLNHITTVTASDSATLDIASTFTDTYNSYFVTFANLIPAVNNSEFVFRLSTDNGSSFTSLNYKFVLKHFYVGPSGDGNSESTGSSSIRIGLAVSSTAAEGGLTGHMYIHSPTNSAVRTYINWFAFMRMGDGSNTGATLLGGGMAPTNTDDDAFQFKNESGNISSGTVRVYGIANS